MLALGPEPEPGSAPEELRTGSSWDEGRGARVVDTRAEERTVQAGCMRSSSHGSHRTVAGPEPGTNEETVKAQGRTAQADGTAAAAAGRAESKGFATALLVHAAIAVGVGVEGGGS